MPLVTIYNQVVEELAEAFPKLSKDHDIYLSPMVMEVAGVRDLNLQVCDGGIRYDDVEGSVRKANFHVTIGILKVFKVDYAGRAHRYLEHTEESIFVAKNTIIDTLGGSYLKAFGEALITNPLRIATESSVEKGKEQGLLVKKLSFLGGYIVGV